MDGWAGLGHIRTHTANHFLRDNAKHALGSYVHTYKTSYPHYIHPGDDDVLLRQTCAVWEQLYALSVWRLQEAPHPLHWKQVHAHGKAAVETNEGGTKDGRHDATRTKH